MAQFFGQAGLEEGGPGEAGPGDDGAPSEAETVPEAAPDTSQTRTTPSV